MNYEFLVLVSAGLVFVAVCFFTAYTISMSNIPSKSVSGKNKMTCTSISSQAVSSGVGPCAYPCTSRTRSVDSGKGHASISKDEVEQSACPWGELEKELLQHVLSWLCDHDLASARLVSCHWRDAASEVVARLSVPVVFPESPGGAHLGEQVLQLQTSFPCVEQLVIHNNQTWHPDRMHSALEHIGQWEQLVSVEILDAQYWSCPWEISCLGHLRQISSLSLLFQVAERVAIMDSDTLPSQLEALSRLTQLKRLRVWLMVPDDDLCLLQDDFFTFLSTLTDLEVLALNCVKITEHAVSVVTMLSNLQSLTIHGDLMSVSMQGFMSVLSLGHLTKLEVSQQYDWHDNGEQATDWVWPESSPGVTLKASKLQYLQLPLSPPVMTLAPELASLPCLRQLLIQEPLHLDTVRPFSENLSRVQLSSVSELFIDGFSCSMASLAALRPLTALTSLTLCNTTVDLEDIQQALSVLASLVHVREFCLDLEERTYSVPITDEMLGTLATSWKQLSSLHYDCHISNSTQQVTITSIERMTNLRALSIHHSGVGVYSLDCGRLPSSLASLCVFGVTLEEPYLLHQGLKHLRISAGNLCASDMYVFSRHLTGLETLMLKRDSSESRFVTPSNLSFLTSMTCLQALGLSVVGDLDLEPLTALTNLTKLVLHQDENEPGKLVPWYRNLMRLTCLTKLRSLWLSEELAPHHTFLRMQSQLQHCIPFLVVQLVENDRFWMSDIIMNESLEWWTASAWPDSFYSPARRR